MVLFRLSCWKWNWSFRYKWLRCLFRHETNMLNCRHIYRCRSERGSGDLRQTSVMSVTSEHIYTDRCSCWSPPLTGEISRAMLVWNHFWYPTSTVWMWLIKLSSSTFCAFIHQTARNTKNLTFCQTSWTWNKNAGELCLSFCQINVSLNILHFSCTDTTYVQCIQRK